MTREEEIRAKHREYMGGEPPVRECEECIVDTLVQADIPYLLNENARLRAKNEEWRQINDSTGFEYEKLRTELDAAMNQVRGRCATCTFVGDCYKHDNNDTGEYTWHEDCSDWEWDFCGPCAENGGADA